MLKPRALCLGHALCFPNLLFDTTLVLVQFSCRDYFLSYGNRRLRDWNSGHFLWSFELPLFCSYSRVSMPALVQIGISIFELQM